MTGLFFSGQADGWETQDGAGGEGGELPKSDLAAVLALACAFENGDLLAGVPQPPKRSSAALAAALAAACAAANGDCGVLFAALSELVSRLNACAHVRKGGRDGK